jgi:hypothetical protein
VLCGQFEKKTRVGRENGPKFCKENIRDLKKIPQCVNRSGEWIAL